MTTRTARTRAGTTAAPGKAWYSITNQTDTSASVMLYDEIGAWGVSAGDFVRELRDVKASTIDLHVNSPGGDVFDGMAIYNALKNHPANVSVTVDGIAASAASFVAMAGDTVTMARNAQLMIHDAHAIAAGSAKDMTAMVDLLNRCSDNIADIYAQRAGGTKDEWRDRMRAETWYSADEAVKAGLADEVAPTMGRVRNSWDLSLFNYAGREQAPDPFPTNTAPPESEPVPDPADEPGFSLPALDVTRIRDAVESLDGISFAPGLITAAIALGANDCPAPDPPAPPVPEPSGPDMSINLPGLRRAIREAQL